MWLITSIIYIALLIIKDKELKRYKDTIDAKMEIIRKKNCIITKMYGKNEAMLVNCKRYLEQITELKKQLKKYESTIQEVDAGSTDPEESDTGLGSL